MKRLFDIVVAIGALVFLLPLFLLVAVLIKLDSPGPIFFKQERIGRRFRPFQILKFRTMVHNATARGRSITAGDDPRITRMGWFLRKSKIDELPQLDQRAQRRNDIRGSASGSAAVRRHVSTRTMKRSSRSVRG